MRGKQTLNMFEREWEEAKTYLVPPPNSLTHSNQLPEQRKTNENKFTTNLPRQRQP